MAADMEEDTEEAMEEVSEDLQDRTVHHMVEDLDRTEGMADMDLMAEDFHLTVVDMPVDMSMDTVRGMDSSVDGIFRDIVISYKDEIIY